MGHRPATPGRRAGARGAVGHRRRRCRQASAALAALLLGLSPPAPCSEPGTASARPSTGAGAGDARAGPPYAGRPLAEVLLGLQAQGLAIVFTSELVRPEMRVLSEPSARQPRRLLEEVLAAHGLAIQEGPGSLLVVVAQPVTAIRRGAAIEGRVLALGGRQGVGGAVVRVVGRGLETPVRDDGGFSISGLEPGVYTLQASATGYLDQRMGVVLVGGGRRRLDFRLRPQPFLEEEIVVRPSRLTLLHERPDASFSLGREEIESLPQLGGDLFRTASLLPGTASNDVTAQFSVHGGRRDEVRILLDGQELYDAYHLKDYDNALSIVPARHLSSASLTTGAYPVSQGDRMSGVFDLRTAEPPPGRHYVLGLSVLDVLLSASDSFAGERGAWLATGRRGSAALAGNFLDDEDPTFWDLFGKADLATDLGRLGVRLLAAADELEVDKVDEDGFERLENDYRSSYAWLTHEALLGERLLVESAASWAQARRSRSGIGTEEEGSFDLRDRRRLEVLAATQAWSMQRSPRHLPRWGGELRRYRATFDYAKLHEPELLVLAPFAPPRLLQHQFAGTLQGDHLGLWASDRISLHKLTVEAGGRYDRHTATGDTLLSPRLNLAWRLGERSVLRGGWGRFFQSQRPYELQVEDGERTLQRAELSEHWVLGYETLPAAAGGLGLDAFRLELFHRGIDDPRPRYENLLEPLNVFPEIEPDRVRIAPRRSTASGVEMLLRGRRGPRFDWWLAYSYARVEDHLESGRVARSWDQPHTLTVDGNYRLPRGWNLNLAWRYHSGWPTTPVEARMVVDEDEPEEGGELAAVFGPLNSERLPAYHRLDLRASRGWELRRGRVTFFVDVQNLYDRRNLAGFDVELDDEEEVVELEREEWPGIFPSLGVTWEF